MGKIAAVWASLLVLTVSCSNQIAAPESGSLENGQSSTALAATNAPVAADVRACSNAWKGEVFGVNSADCLEGKAGGKMADRKTICEMIFTRGGELELETATELYRNVQTSNNSTEAAYSVAAALGLEISNFKTSNGDATALVVFLIGDQGNELGLTVDGATCKVTLD